MRKAFKDPQERTQKGPGEQQETSVHQTDDSCPRSTVSEVPISGKVGRKAKYTEPLDGVGKNMNTDTQARNDNAGPTTFEDNLEIFSQRFISGGRKATTVKTFRDYLNRCYQAMGKDPVHWTTQDLDDFTLTDIFHAWAPSTQKTVKGIVRSYLKVLHEDIPENWAFWKGRAVAAGGTNAYDNLKRKAASREDVELALEMCRDQILSGKNDNTVFRCMALYLTVAYGLREMETAALRLCDVDIEAGTIHVVESKGGKSRLIHVDVPLSPRLWDSFMAARSSIIGSDHVLTKLSASLNDRAASLWFYRTTENAGKPMSPNTMGKFLARVAKRLLGHHQAPHGWRHAKIFSLIEVEGWDIQVVSKYAGHEDIKTTMGYCATGIEEQRAADRDAKARRANGTAPSPSPAPSAAPEPSPSLDAAVRALTALLSAGHLSPAAYTEAVLKLEAGAL